MLVTPARWSGPGSFDRESADVVMQLNDASYDAGWPGGSGGSRGPNTFGEFVDDGAAISVLARNAVFDRMLLYLFTSL